MSVNWYKETIEALGLLSPKEVIINKLNVVAAHADDSKLRQLAEDLIREIQFADFNPRTTRPRNMTGVKSIDAAISYCESKAYSE